MRHGGFSRSFKRSNDPSFRSSGRESNFSKRAGKNFLDGPSILGNFVKDYDDNDAKSKGFETKDGKRVKIAKKIFEDCFGKFEKDRKY